MSTTERIEILKRLSARCLEIHKALFAATGIFPFGHWCQACRGGDANCPLCRGTGLSRLGLSAYRARARATRLSGRARGLEFVLRSCVSGRAEMVVHGDFAREP